MNMTGDINLDHLVKGTACQGFSAEMFFPFHTLFFGSEPLSPVHNRGDRVSFTSWRRGHLHILFRIFLKGRFVSYPSFIYLYNHLFVLLWTHIYLLYTLGYDSIQAYLILLYFVVLRRYCVIYK